MATGVQPRNDDVQFNRADLEVIEDAMKKKQFRDLLVEYCQEIRDPANQAIYQKEMTQMEKERGFDVTFINPEGGYVIKTSVAGDRKAFINICSNDNVGKPSCSAQVVDGRRGVNWQLPYSLIPPREDYNRKREKCVIYDVVFHPDTLRMAAKNKQFRELVNNTAVGALRDTYNIHLDSNNFKFVKSPYKGMATPAVIRKEDPNFKSNINDDENEDLPPEVLEKLYPQKVYATPQKKPTEKRKTNTCTKEFSHSSNKGYTIPKYVIKQQKDVDMQDFTFTKDCKQYSAIPTKIVIEINLPLLSSTKDCELEVKEKSLYLQSEKPAKYKLELNLPYSVNDQCGDAKFDKSKRKLIVTLPVIKAKGNTPVNLLKVDSGVESEGNYESLSEEEKECLVEEISSTTNTMNEDVSVATEASETKECAFFEPSLSYLLPSYTNNVLDDTIAFTFHVKNTDPESVRVKEEGNKIFIKFTSIGSGFVPVHYAAMLVFDDVVIFENVSGEAWDNNVILQLQASAPVPQHCQVGLTEECLKMEQFESLKSNAETEELVKSGDVLPPIVEVTNLGSETNIVVSKNDTDDDSDPQEPASPTSSTEKEIVWSSSGRQISAAHSILRKPLSRSYSESSAGDVASSMDYISSDCIPEESSLKKTVRFSNNISKQFYRYNSSIEGQKKKNQRKKSKKRSQERRRSESEAEDDHHASSLESKSILKSSSKARRDSGLADTSDGDTDAKGSPDAGPPGPRRQPRPAASPATTPISTTPPSSTAASISKLSLRMISSSIWICERRVVCRGAARC